MVDFIYKSNMFFNAIHIIIKSKVIQGMQISGIKLLALITKIQGSLSDTSFKRVRMKN